MSLMFPLLWLGLGGCSDPCASTWYADLDGDGFGDPRSSVEACEVPWAYVANADDCDDDDASSHPGAIDPCNGIDEDCDGELDEDGQNQTLYLDADRDGAGSPSSSWTGCDGQSPPLYTAAAGNDCDDLDPEVRPGRVERCNGRDDDCDGSRDEDAIDPLPFFVDNDGDGHGAGEAVLRCEGDTAGLASTDDDCDDSDPDVFPQAIERCNGRDDDCDGVPDDEPFDAPLRYLDYDFDGWGGEPIRVCDPESFTDATDRPSPPYDYYYEYYYYYYYYYYGADLTDIPGDCNDFRPDVNPGREEVCNLIDDDCDTYIDDLDSNVVDQELWYFDQDRDGFGEYDVYVIACNAPGNNWAAEGGDCAPADASVNPDAPEVCNLIDDDCDDLIDQADPDRPSCP